MRVWDTWILQQVPGPKACFQRVKKMQSGQDQKACTRVGMTSSIHGRERLFGYGNTLPLFFPEKMQLLHLPILELLEWIDSFQKHNKNKVRLL